MVGRLCRSDAITPRFSKCRCLTQADLRIGRNTPESRGRATGFQNPVPPKSPTRKRPVDHCQGVEDHPRRILYASTPAIGQLSTGHNDTRIMGIAASS